jgi:GcrA cell cycle regulator
MGKHFWSDQEDETLKKLWNGGSGVDQIAGHGIFGGRRTKNAIISRAHRLDLPPHRTNKSPAAKDQRGGRKASITLGGIAPQSDGPVVDVGTIDDPLEKMMDTVFGPTRLADLAPRHCRWPEGYPRDPGFHFCGQEKKRGLPYCEAHAEKAYEPPKISNRSKPRFAAAAGTSRRPRCRTKRKTKLN